MSRMGRPPTDEPKDTTIRFRADKEMCAKIEQCQKITSLSKSDIIREAINLFYQKVMETKK